MVEGEVKPTNSVTRAAAGSAESTPKTEPFDMEKALQSPNSRDALAVVARAEKPQDDKNRVVARLHQIRSVVRGALQEQMRGEESHVFYQTAQRVITLGETYTQYLEQHMNDADMDEKVFGRIAQLAKSSFLMNIEQYGRAITSRDPKNKFVTDYLKAHAELAVLDPGGNEGPWKGIKEPLYFSTHNDIREKYREAIAQRSGELTASNDLTLPELDHLERFLVDSQQGRLPKDFIPEYVNAHSGEIQRWVPLSLEEFQSFVLDNIKTSQGDLTSNDFLKTLDEELASIKPEHISNYRDRQTKITFLRSLRFGRIKKDELVEVTRPKQVDLFDRPDLAPTLAPILRKEWKGFRQLIETTRGESSETRKAKLFDLLDQTDVTDEMKAKVKAYIQTNL